MPAGKRLPRAYYQSLDVTQIARDLLGKYLVANIDGFYCSGIIVETEAYRGPDDKASHSYNNRRTPRTNVMYEAGGVAYVYICYGMHHLMNVVTGPKEHAHAVLIRALEPAEGIEVMALRRNMKEGDSRLTKGPGALSVALRLTSDLSGASMHSSSSMVWIEDRGLQFEPDAICSGPRIGVESAGEAALWPWRYFVKGNKYVSAKKTCS
ncbi:MAG: DNA-3-methyladenine glycosylase [Saprospiraceae bacterium]|nr:DNA-3-methyladenine glycosylase [Saprospiraceae bacterium]